MTDDDYDLQYKEWCKEQHRIAVEDYRHGCKVIQDRLRCPNCRTIWECNCTATQVQVAWNHIEARRQAEYHERVRRCDEDLARRQAAWDKQHGGAE